MSNYGWGAVPPNQGYMQTIDRGARDPLAPSSPGGGYIPPEAMRPGWTPGNYGSVPSWKAAAYNQKMRYAPNAGGDAWGRYVGRRLGRDPWQAGYDKRAVKYGGGYGFGGVGGGYGVAPMPQPRPQPMPMQQAAPMPQPRPSRLDYMMMVE